MPSIGYRISGWDTPSFCGIVSKLDASGHSTDSGGGGGGTSSSKSKIRELLV